MPDPNKASKTHTAGVGGEGGCVTWFFEARLGKFELCGRNGSAPKPIFLVFSFLSRFHFFWMASLTEIDHKKDSSELESRAWGFQNRYHNVLVTFLQEFSRNS